MGTVFEDNAKNVSDVGSKINKPRVCPVCRGTGKVSATTVDLPEWSETPWIVLNTGENNFNRFKEGKGR